MSFINIGIYDFWPEFFESTLGANKNWGRWSDIVKVMLLEITSWEIILENIYQWVNSNSSWL